MATISFSGLASGIDSDALIKATLDAQRLAYKPLQDNIDSNKKESAALQTFNTKLLGLNDSMKDFLTLAGNGISKIGISSDKDLVDVSVSDSAPASSTTVSVQQLAKGATFSFNDKFASLDSAVAPTLAGSESVTFTVGTGSTQKTVQANVTSTTTLRDLAEQLSVNGEGIFSVSPINLGSDANPQYELVVNTADTGVDNGTLAVSVSAGLQAAGALTGSTIDQAKDAIFTLAGIGQVTRGSNKISGIIAGVTFDLKQAANVPVQITVNNDNDKTTSRFNTIITQINDLLKYSRDNSTVTRDESTTAVTNVFGDLAHTRLDDQAVQDIKDALGDGHASGGTTVQSFADMGLKTNKDGTLSLDTEAFTTALSQDPKGAGQLLNQFADKLGATGGVIDGYTRFQGTIQSAVTSNDDQTQNLQDRIDAIEENLSKQQDMLKQMFTNLETKTAQLQSNAGALSSLTGFASPSSSSGGSSSSSG